MNLHIRVLMHSIISVCQLLISMSPLLSLRLFFSFPVCLSRYSLACGVGVGGWGGVIYSVIINTSKEPSVYFNII